MELIVGMLMFTIISITVSMLLAPILSSYTRANDFAEYNALLDNIANQIISDLSQSRQVPPPDIILDADEWAEDDYGDFVTITTRNGVIVYSVNYGRLQRNGRDVFAEDFYKRKHVSFMLEANDDDNPTAYTLTVRLTEAREPGAASFEIQREYAVRPLMLNQG